MIVETVNIFANPIAGRGKGQAIAERLRLRLESEGYRVKACFDRPEAFTADVLGDSPRAAIVIGGDGTLRGVTDKLYKLYGSVPPILPVPLGTANLMVRHLGFRWNDDDAIEDGVSAAIRRLRVKLLDVGQANGKLFLLMAGIGFDAQIVHELDRIRQGPIHLLSYLMPAAMALRDYQFPPLRVYVDGTQVWRYSPAIAFVGNVKEYGTGFPVLPYAKSDDGLLDICILPCRRWLDLAQWFALAAIEQHVWVDRIKYLKGKRVVIQSQGQVPVQVDGDPGGFTPLDIGLLPMRLPFIVP